MASLADALIGYFRAVGSGLYALGPGLIGSAMYCLSAPDRLQKNIAESLSQDDQPYQPPPPKKPSLGSEFFFVITVIVNEIAAIFAQVALIIATQLSTLIFALIGTVIIVLWLYLFQLYIGYVWYIGLELIGKAIVLFLIVITPIVNIILDAAAIAAPSINVFWRLIIQFIVLFFQLICPANPLTGNVFADCPLIELVITYVITYYKTIFAIWATLFELLARLVEYIGTFICSGGVCGAAAVTGYNPMEGTVNFYNGAQYCKPLPNGEMPTSCPYDTTVFLNWLKKAFDDVKELVVPFAQLILTFLSDIWKYAAYSLLSLVRPTSTTGPLSFTSSTDSALAAVKISDSNRYKEDFELMKQSGLDVQKGFKKTFDDIRRGLLTSTILLDSATCNVFQDIKNCAAVKLCYYFDSPFSNIIPFTIPTLPPILLPPFFPLTIPVPVLFEMGDICRSAGLYPGQCACDQHIYTDPLISALVPNLSKSRNACIIASRPSIRKCLRLFVGGFWVFTTSPAGTINCLCNNIVDYFGTGQLIHDGIWVPCVPGQGVCLKSISVLAKIINA